jgi:hypothetical protein
MELLLTRLVFDENYTEGQLFIDDFYFCDTLEDRTRDYDKDGEVDEKIYGETAIPFDRYKVIMSYSNRFKKVMPEVLNVHGFEGIRIHEGNAAKDTLGCILTGKYVKDGQIGESKVTTQSLYAAIEEAIKNKEDVYLTIT